MTVMTQPIRGVGKLHYTLDVLDPDSSIRRRFRFTNKAERDKAAKDAERNGFVVMHSQTVRSYR